MARKFKGVEITFLISCVILSTATQLTSSTQSGGGLVTIPKTASTEITTWLMDLNRGWREAIGEGERRVIIRRGARREDRVWRVNQMLVLALLITCGDIKQNPGPISSAQGTDPPPPIVIAHLATDITAGRTGSIEEGSLSLLPSLPLIAGPTGREGETTARLPLVPLGAGSSQADGTARLPGNEEGSHDTYVPLPSPPPSLGEAEDTPTAPTTPAPSSPGPTLEGREGHEETGRGDEAGDARSLGAQDERDKLGKGLRFLHLNIRSIIPKITEARLLAIKYTPTVLAITESWLDPTIGNAEIRIEGYNVIRKDRNRRGGGVILYINNTIAYNPRNDLSLDNYETLWADLLLPNTKPILVGVCYRPPEDNTFLEKFNRTLTAIDERSEVIILGDMNICFDSRCSALTKEYKQMLDLNSIKQIITAPTRVTEQTSNILDHILCTREDRIAHSGVIELGLSDHYLIYCTRKHPKHNIGKHNTIKIRSLRNYSKGTYENMLRAVNWSRLYYITDVDEAWTTFKTILTEIIDKVAPKKDIRIKNRTDPWLNNELLHQIATRDKLLKQLSRNRNNAELRQEYNRTRNKLARDIKTAKAEYFYTMAEENKHDPRKLWKYLKKSGYKEQPKGASDMVLSINGNVCHDKKVIANHFNSFFTTIAGTLAQSLPPSTNKFTTNTPKFQDYYTNKGIYPRSHTLSTVTTNFTLQELTKLKTNKSTGPDYIPARFLKDGASILAEPLTYIINLSITTETVPRELKEAIVTPIFKKGDKLNVSNYRPVSILCIAAKILERAVCTQLDQYLKDNDVLYAFQSGFRGKYSTETCLIHLMDYIRGQMAQGSYTGLVLMDLQKAFDTVDHHILCNKLEAMGIGSANWFRSYLSNRTQKVKIGDTMSCSLPINCGVPQGSILGPLLFLCYINDMPISVECKLLLYADDSALLVSHKDAKAVSDTLTKELESCNEWLIDNRLSLHLGKTEAMLCGTRRKIRNNEDFDVKCKGTAIESVTEVKYLGIKIDETLSGEGILDSIVKKCTGRIKFMYRQAGCFPKDIKRTLCQSLIQCHLDYAISSWYAAMTTKAKRKLQIVQNKIVRFILDVGPRTHLTSENMRELDLLRVSDRAKQLRINNAYKIYYNQSPGYLQENFVRTRDRPNQHTRSSQWNFNVPTIKGAESKTFYYNAIKDWNSIPIALKSCENIGLFKKGIKKFLSQQATEEARREYV